jgi:hypothetical protein
MELDKFLPFGRRQIAIREPPHNGNSVLFVQRRSGVPLNLVAIPAYLDLALKGIALGCDAIEHTARNFAHPMPLTKLPRECINERTFVLGSPCVTQ